MTINAKYLKDKILICLCQQKNDRFVSLEGTNCEGNCGCQNVSCYMIATHSVCLCSYVRQLIS